MYCQFAWGASNVLSFSQLAGKYCQNALYSPLMNFALLTLSSCIYVQQQVAFNSDLSQGPGQIYLWLLVHVRVNWLQHLICSDIFIYISGHEYETMNIAQQLLQSLNISNISMMSNVKKNYNLKSPKGHRVFKYFKY